MRKQEILIGGGFLVVGTVAVASFLVGGESAKWGVLILGVGTIICGFFQWYYEQRK